MSGQGGGELGAPAFSVLNMTLADVEHQLGGGGQALGSLNVEEVLKGLWGSTTLDTLPSFMRAPSWQQGGAAAKESEQPPQQQQAQAQQQAAQQQGRGPSAAIASAGSLQGAKAWEAAAAAAHAQQAAHQQHVHMVAQQAAAAAQQQQQQQQQQQAEVLPLASVRMDQIFSWFAEQQASLHGRPQAPLPTMTLSQIFDSAGLQLTGGAPSLQQQLAAQAAANALGAAGGMQPASLPMPGSLGGPSSGSIHSLGLHPQAMATASLLPPGITPAGPFASAGPASLPVDVSLMPPGGLAPAPASAPPALPAAGAEAAAGGGRPPTAAAARAARARKRKDASLGPDGGSGSEGGGPAGPKRGRGNGGLSAAEAAAQAKAVAERAAQELQQLPSSLDDKEARAIKRAIKNRESAARSRAKRQEYTATLEAQVEELKQQNLELRKEVITSAAAPPDKHAGSMDGDLMRRSRTGPF